MSVYISPDGAVTKPANRYGKVSLCEIGNKCMELLNAGAPLAGEIGQLIASSGGGQRILKDGFNPAGKDGKLTVGSGDKQAGALGAKPSLQVGAISMDPTVRKALIDARIENNETPAGMLVASTH